MNATRHATSIGYWLAFIGPLALLAFLMQHYIDFTDQAFYLLHVSRPEHIKIAANLYYLYLAPIYQWLNNNIYAYRLFGLALLLLCSLPLGYYTQRAVFTFRLAGYWPVFLLSVLSFYKPFLIDPGYNWFNTLGIMLYAAGMIALVYPRLIARSELWSGLLIGLGGVMSFAAKPTTGAILAVEFALLGIALWAGFKRPLRDLARVYLLAAIVVVVSAFIHVLVIDSPGQIAERFGHALTYFTMLQAGYSLPDQLIRIYYDLEGTLAVIIQPSIFFWPVFVLSLATKRTRQWVDTHPHTMLTAFVLSLLAGLYATPFYAGTVFSEGGMGVRMLFGMFYLTLALGRIYLKPYLGLYDSRALVLVVLFFAITYAYRAGSNLHYIFLLNYQGGLLFSLFLFAGKGFLQYERFACLCRLCFFPLFALLFIATCYQAYHQPQRSTIPVYRQQTLTRITDNPNNILYLGEHSNRYIETARAAFRQHGFEPGDYIIDLTGISPIIQLIAGARPLPFPWMGGGTGGSDQAAIYNLSLIPKDSLKRAWVLSPGEHCHQNTAISPSVMHAYRLDFPQAYHAVATLTFPWPDASDCQTLWKPEY